MNNEQNVPMDEFLMVHNQQHLGNLINTYKIVTTFYYSYQTCLPAGDYCDVISGNVYNGTCSGKTIRVALSGSAEIYIPHTDETRMVAIHVEVSN